MFSIIIPLYNKAPYIQRALDSVLNQSFKDYEIIVVNDGSTDGGEEIVSKVYGNKLKLIQQENQGVSVARNTGITKADFDYIAFLDADDCWHPDFLFWIDKVLSKNPELKMLGSSYSNATLPNTIENPRIELILNYFDRADANTLFTSSSTVIHKSFFNNNIGFKPHLVIGEDIDIWLRAVDYFGKVAYLQAPLMFYDLEASSSTETAPKLVHTIFSEMYLEEYTIGDRSSSWISFRDKYLLLNLVFFFDQKENYKTGKELLQKKRNSFFFAEIPYRIPYALLKYSISKSLIRNLIRKYLKFCFRYIYT